MDDNYYRYRKIEWFVVSSKIILSLAFIHVQLWCLLAEEEEWEEC
jgi:hypothetical protein